MTAHARAGRFNGFDEPGDMILVGVRDQDLRDPPPAFAADSQQTVDLERGIDERGLFSDRTRDDLTKILNQADLDLYDLEGHATSVVPRSSDAFFAEGFPGARACLRRE